MMRGVCSKWGFYFGKAVTEQAILILWTLLALFGLQTIRRRIRSVRLVFMYTLLYNVYLGREAWDSLCC